MPSPRSNIVSAEMPTAALSGVSGAAEFRHLMFPFLQTVITPLACFPFDNSRRLSKPQCFSGLKEIPRAS
jgi:hypothetical protein